MKQDAHIEPMRDEHGRPAVFAPLCKSIINARAASMRSFGSLCADPGSEMLLDLYWRESQGLKTSLTSLWLASKASEMTGRRCLAAMEEQGIVERMPDPSDGRRINVRFTPEGRKKMDEGFGALLLGYAQTCQDCANQCNRASISADARDADAVPFCIRACSAVRRTSHVAGSAECPSRLRG
ncbi:MAG: winged helix DNA-binding protein [Novosphingobium sp.]|jgi:ribosomal protein S19E (S16A)|uniref:winged helix DNA-binding protein n=1 Tax=Sphingobium sp. TaxID=1912891 RepID=UPI00257CDDA7|nr:winged helix DNA-binding protein [Sphingobium sp.]